MSETNAPKVVVYTDGACKGNPGPGGWGVWMVSGPHEKELWGGERSTTNNDVIRNPEITKKTSTPTYPPVVPGTPKWKSRTAMTATARSPSMSRRCFTASR